MSAYLCDPRHIGALASWYVDRRDTSRGYLRSHILEDETVEDYMLAPELAVLLARANVASVAYRYPDDKPGERPGPSVADDEEYVELCAEAARRTVDIDAVAWRTPAIGGAVQVLKATQCYEYQACEHPGWDRSKAHRAVEAIRSAAISALRGYSDAVWGWPEPQTREQMRADLRARGLLA